MLHRNNREGYGNINLEIYDIIQNNYINISYKKLIDLKSNLNIINDDIQKNKDILEKYDFDDIQKNKDELEKYDFDDIQKK